MANLRARAPRVVARKRFGQHFLEPAWRDKVIRAIDARASDHIIEIGPGRGALTVPLSASGAALTAVEIDRDLAADLRARELPGVTVVEGDILELWPSVLEAHPHPRIVGNLPYNISSPVLFRVLESGGVGAIADATLMVQLEVAERVCAPPGDKTYGTLSVLAGRVSRPAIVLRLPPGAFRPAPQVHSAVVRLDFDVSSRGGTEARATEALSEELHHFAAFVRDIFAHRRKTLANALRQARSLTPAAVEAVLSSVDLPGRARPETLSPTQFTHLHRALRSRSAQASS